MIGMKCACVCGSVCARVCMCVLSSNIVNIATQTCMQKSSSCFFFFFSIEQPITPHGENSLPEAEQGFAPSSALHTSPASKPKDKVSLTGPGFPSESGIGNGGLGTGDWELNVRTIVMKNDLTRTCLKYNF